MSRKCPSGQNLEDLLGIHESPQNLLLLNKRQHTHANTFLSSCTSAGQWLKKLLFLRIIKLFTLPFRHSLTINHLQSIDSEAHFKALMALSGMSQYLLRSFKVQFQFPYLVLFLVTAAVFEMTAEKVAEDICIQASDVGLYIVALLCFGAKML